MVITANKRNKLKAVKPEEKLQQARENSEKAVKKPRFITAKG